MQRLSIHKSTGRGMVRVLIIACGTLQRGRACEGKHERTSLKFGFCSVIATACDQTTFISAVAGGNMNIPSPAAQTPRTARAWCPSSPIPTKMLQELISRLDFITKIYSYDSGIKKFTTCWSFTTLELNYGRWKKDECVLI